MVFAVANGLRRVVGRDIDIEDDNGVLDEPREVVVLETVVTGLEDLTLVFWGECLVEKIPVWRARVCGPFCKRLDDIDKVELLVREGLKVDGDTKEFAVEDDNCVDDM